MSKEIAENRQSHLSRPLFPLRWRRPLQVKELRDDSSGKRLKAQA